MAIGQEVFLVSPLQAFGTLMQLLPQAEFWQRVAFSAGHILLGFVLGGVCSVLLAVAAERWLWVDAMLAPVMQLVKATPVASFIILALVWVSGKKPFHPHQLFNGAARAVRRGAHRAESADPQLLEMARVFRLPLGAAGESHLAPGGAARVPAGVQRGAGHLLEERRGSGSHRPAGRQHR